LRNQLCLINSVDEGIALMDQAIDSMDIASMNLNGTNSRVMERLT
jgi:hypothetical protein